MVISKVQIVISFQEALKQLLDCARVSVGIKHKINSFPPDCYLLTWFFWFSQQFVCSNYFMVKASKQVRLCTHKEQTGRRGCSHNTEAQQRDCNVNSQSSVYACTAITRKQHVILAEMLCRLRSSLTTKEKYVENIYACDAKAVFMSWLLLVISGSSINTEPSSSYITPKYYKTDILTNSHQL